MEVVMADIEAQTVFKKEIHPVSLKFEDVVYTLTTKHEGWLKKSKSEEKLILNGVSGIVFPGEMLAMLGPSGSGKTTLLTALGGRLGGLLGGTITYNGKPFSGAMKQNTGFVTQDDLLYTHLTVTETLVYTALLRLPNSMSKQEKVNHAEAVISQLGLSRCRDSIIGGPFLRGISGGERKRVSIGQEMLINPSLLFLDEPTSGLDSTTAQRIVHTLWELANGGHTVVMTIHQPSSRLFYMFHKVLLLSEGNPLYFGKGASAMDYFASIGFSPSVAMNPSDFLLDLANGVSTDDSLEDQAAVKQILISAYKANLAERVKSEHASDRHLQEATDDKQFKRWSTSWWQQFSVLFKRGVKVRMHEYFSKIRIIEILIMSVLAGLLWWQSGRSHIQDQVALFFFYCGFWGFYQVESAIFVFPQERMILEKERQAGMYSLSSFFMAVTLGNLPMRLVLPAAFVTITYWMAGLKATAANFLACLFILLFSILCFEGLGLAIGALVMNQKSATTLGSVISSLTLLTGGFYLQHIPKFIAWLKYVSITNYTFKLFLHSQYNPGETYPCGTNGTCLVEDFPTVKAVGLRGGVVVSLAALVVMLVAYRLIAYIALMRIGVLRR